MSSNHDATTETATPTTDKPKPSAKTRIDPKSKPKTLPPHAVILYNDDINRFEWVVGVLRKVIRCSGTKAFVMTLRAHFAGRCIVWSGSKEVAEFKAQQLKAVGPDPRKPAARPLKVSTEPLPG